MPAALVGKLGSGPLAAVGLSSALFNFSNFLFSFLMVVTTPKVASAVARNKLDEVRSIFAISACLPQPSVHWCRLTSFAWSDSLFCFPHTYKRTRSVQHQHGWGEVATLCA